MIPLDEQNFLGFVETPSELGRYEHYAVSTDAKPCAKIGSSLLAKGGSAIDAAIGTLLCMGVTIPNSMGLGGGCIWTIYNRTTRQAIVIDGREIAPDYSSENMFANSSLAASRGSLSIGVPGELASYWKAHQMFGKLKWSELFDESISMAEIGSPMVEHLSFALRQQSHAQYITPPLAAIYKGPTNNQYLKEGEILVQKALGNTLRRIRNNGAAEFYGGQTGKLFVDDLQKQGGKMTLENLMKYEALIKEPLKVDLGSDLTLFTPPPPASGIVLSIILRIMKGLGYYKNLNPQNNQDDSNLYYHRLAEAFKYAYAQRAGLEDNPDDPERMEQLLKKLSSDKFIEEVVSKITNETHNDSRYGGDEYFSEDHGTAHVSVLDSEGNAVAVTTSVNLYFGSGMVSPSTGIVYNDVMDDFVSPNLVNKFALAPSKFNRIRPGKRPVSSMAPSVFVDADGNARLIIGASGGAKITTAIATVSLRNCFLGEDIKTAIDGPRIHHQFLPNKVWFELNFPDEILVSLKERGHSLNPILDRSSVVMAVANDRVDGKNSITANSDHRKGGAVHGS